MVPTSWLTVVLFLFLIAPGLLFDLLADRRRASVTESAFREAGRVILASLVFDSFAFVVLMGIQRLHPRWVPDPAAMVRGGIGYVADHYNLVLITIIVQTLLATAAAGAVHLLFAMRGGGTIRQVSAWTQVFKRDCPKGTKPIVRVRLTGGSIYAGLVVNFTSDHKLESRELVLTRPLAAKASGAENGLTDLPSQYDRVVLRGAAIDVIAVEYRPSWMLRIEGSAEAEQIAVAGTPTMPTQGQPEQAAVE
jgi:hypothetical protein